MHAFAGATGIFYCPAFTACSRLFTTQKLCSQFFHVLTRLYINKGAGQQFKFVACIVLYFIVGQTARAYRPNGASF
jgi:hypothetical protein